MTWNREEALRLAQALDTTIGTNAANRAQTRYDAARQLETAVTEIAAITSERDSLRQQLAEATASLEFADRTASAQLEHVRGLERRIAELEAADESSKFAIRSIAETHNRQTDEVYALQAIIRAIYPVYRAANEWVVNGRNRQAFVSATHTARAALTPDLIAAIKSVTGATPTTTDHHGCSDERCRRCYGEP